MGHDKQATHQDTERGALFGEARARLRGLCDVDHYPATFAALLRADQHRREQFMRESEFRAEQHLALLHTVMQLASAAGVTVVIKHPEREIH